MDIYASVNKILPKPITVAIMIPLVMIFLFLVVPVVLVFSTIIFIYKYFKNKKYEKNPHYQKFERNVLPHIKKVFGSKEKPSDAVVDVEYKNVDKDKSDN